MGYKARIPSSQLPGADKDGAYELQTPGERAAISKFTESSGVWERRPPDRQRPARHSPARPGPRALPVRESNDAAPAELGGPHSPLGIGVRPPVRTGERSPTRPPPSPPAPAASSWHLRVRRCHHLNNDGAATTATTKVTTGGRRRSGSNERGGVTPDRKGEHSPRHVLRIGLSTQGGRMSTPRKWGTRWGLAGCFPCDASEGCMVWRVIDTFWTILEEGVTHRRRSGDGRYLMEWLGDCIAKSILSNHLPSNSYF